MKKKNMLSLMLAGCLALSLTACGGQSESGAGDADSTPPPGDATIPGGMIAPHPGCGVVSGTNF